MKTAGRKRNTNRTRILSLNDIGALVLQTENIIFNFYMAEGVTVEHLKKQYGYVLKDTVINAYFENCGIQFDGSLDHSS